MTLDPIRPYADLIRLLVWAGFALAIAGGGFYGGLQWNADEVADERARVADLNRALGSFVETFDAVNEQHRLDRKAAEAQAKRADAAILRADQRAAGYRSALGEVQDEIEEAKRDPECKAILERATCAVLR